MVIFLAVLLCGVRSGLAASEMPEFAIQTWTTQDGMPQNSVTALLQTRAGYIWAATYNGIAQFDGVRFKVFDSSNTEDLPNSRITSLFEDAQGDLWIGHDTGDLTRYSGGTFHREPVRGDWFRGTISGIRADRHGDVWMLNIRGEAQRVRDGLVVKPPREMAEFPSLVPQLALDDQKRLLMIRNGYVAEILPSGIHRIEFASAELRPYYACVTPAKAGGLWVSGDGRVRRWARESWQQDLGTYPWGDAFVICMLESSSGHLLVGTLQSGLFIYAPSQGWVNFNRTNGLPQNWIRCLAEDQEHNLWVGNSGGLVIMQPSVGMQSPPDNWEGYPVQAIIRATNGAVWAATEGAGLYRLQDNSWTRYGVESGLSNSYVWSLIQDRHGDIWAGTWGGGLFRLEGDRFVRQFDLEQRGEPVTALCETPDGTLWIGTAVGLMRWSSNKLERFAPMKGALAGDVRALAVGQDGRFWIGTQGSGMVCYENGRFRTICQTNGLPSDYILSLYEDSDRTLWIGTLDRGLCRYRDGKYKVISTKDGLPHNAVGHIEDDGLGSLWLNTQRGLVRVSKTNLHAFADGHLATLPAQVFRKGAGLASLAGSSGFTPSGFRAPNGDLWFPTSRGIAVVSPESIHANQVPPAVWIEEILVDGQPVKLTPIPPKSRNQNGGKALTREVQLKPGQSQIDVVYTGVTFNSPERVRFKYRLDGYHRDWIDRETMRQVNFSFLPPDEYVFRVIACNTDGLWNETGDAVTIILLPHFWQTWWFKSGLVLAGIAAVWGALHLEARRRLRGKLDRVARERELERERARIAQDIHDDLGASLTRIGMLSESATEDLHDPPRAAASLGQIYSTARDLTRAMDEIVWAVNPRHDTLDSLTNYIARFAHDFLSAAHIRCRLDAPMSVPDLTVRSEVRHNLFLAFKETLNNVVKHSGASEVRVTLELAQRGFNLVVADNGTGFDPTKSPIDRGNGRVVSGYGIAGVRTRLEQISGKMSIISRPAEGTRVELFVPLPEITRSPASA